MQFCDNVCKLGGKVMSIGFFVYSDVHLVKQTILECVPYCLGKFHPTGDLCINTLINLKEDWELKKQHFESEKATPAKKSSAMPCRHFCIMIWITAISDILHSLVFHSNSLFPVTIRLLWWVKWYGVLTSDCSVQKEEEITTYNLDKQGVFFWQVYHDFEGDREHMCDV